MNASPGFSWLTTPAWLPLVHALLHTLWQGALAAGGLLLALRLVPARRAGLRYGLSAAALACVVFAGVGTWALMDTPRRASESATRIDPRPTPDVARMREGSSLATPMIVLVPTEGGPAAPTANRSTEARKAKSSKATWWVPWAAAGWLCGVFVCLVRVVGGLMGAGRLRRRCRELTEPRVLALAEGLRSTLGVSRRVRFLVCHEIGVPSMLGVLYPAVLLPASLLTGVPLDQLRAVLAHELAHIRRWDYLANLAQTLVEALLFFNPFVWWISRQVRLEREACCDRIAVKECASPSSYVEALVTVIGRSRLRPAAPLLAASGPNPRGGNALERARRLLVPGYQPVLRVRWSSLAALCILAGMALGGFWWGARAVAQTIQAAGEKTASKPPDAPKTVPGLPPAALAAAREGDAKRALGLLEDSFKPKKFVADDIGGILDGLVRARELRAFTTLHDALEHSGAERWKLGDDLLAGLVRDGRTDFLDALLARRFDLERLTKASASADPATAAWITRRVAEVGKQRADIEALAKAAADNDLPAMKRLVEAGADVNGVGKDDNTPLIRAVFKNRLEAARWLLDHGAQVDKPRLPGWNYTPLCLVNSVAMAELLKERGADVHAKLYEVDVSILDYVAVHAKADVVAWFLKQGLDAKMTTDNRRNLLFNQDDSAVVEVLLEAGADPNHIDEFGRTPLTEAQSAEVARALIRYGADLKPKLPDGATLLEYAVTNLRGSGDNAQKEADYIEELLKAGAEFDPKGNGVRALLSAAFSDRVGEVRVLLDHGVSPDASYMRGSEQYESALSSAASQATRSLKLLLERGADPNAPVPDGQRTALDAAVAFGRFDNADLLRQAGAKGLTDLAYYSAKGDAAKVSELLDGHADPNEASPSGLTPLLYAVRRAQVEVARRLLDGGASVDQFDGYGFSPYLEFALCQSLIEQDASQAQLQWHLPIQEAKARLAAFQQLFTQHPPNFAYRNAAGRTALHQAVWIGNTVVTSRMLEGHPPRFDPNLPDKDGRPALLLAALSPAAKDTREVITINEDTGQQKKWNQQAYLADELIQAGARLDLVVADGKTVGELTLAAARDANNGQLAAVLSDAMQAAPAPGASPSPKGTTTGPTPTPAAPSLDSLAAGVQKFSGDLLAAARAGNGAEVGRLLNTSFSPPPERFSSGAADAMLGDLVRGRELAAFTVLHDQLKQTNYGKDWKPDDAQLASLVKDGRTDFLDVLLARRLDLERLTAAAKSADQTTADWIARRVTEVARRRADIEALEKAADRGDLPAMKALVEGGADINGVGKDDHTPLLHTVFKNRLEAAQYLLDHGALVDKPRHPGWDYTPLCLVNSVPMAELLKKNGANVHAKLYRRDVSILTYVAYFAKADVVAWFLQQGLDPKMIGDNHENLLFGLKDGQTARLLLDAGVDPNQANESGATPLCSARSAAVAQALIDHGATLTGFKKPLLSMMIQFASADAIETVLKTQASPDHAEIQQALMSAAFADQSDTARVLLKYGARPNEPTLWWGDPKDKMWPLMACTINPSAKTAQVLIDAGADPNGGDRPGEFLRNALANRHGDVAAVLRKAGAKDVSNLVYATAIHDQITTSGMLPSAPSYAENPAYWEDVLSTAAHVGNLEVLRAALAKGAPPVAHRNAYEMAASEGQDEALAVLLAARQPGDDPASLRTALWNAAFNSHPYEKQRTAEHFEKCLRLLLDAGGRATGEPVGDNLVVAAVFTRNPGGNPNALEMLVRAGADPNPVTSPKGQPEVRLLDSVQEACARGSCSFPVAETLVKLNHLAPRPAADGAVPGSPIPTPAKTAPEPAGNTENPPAMFGHDISATGTVSMADGTPLGGEEIVATVYSFRGTGGFMVSPGRVENGSFPLYLDEHTTRVTVAVSQKGCATAFAGPFDAANADQLEHLHVKLTRGYTAAVQVVDAAGRPVAGARLRPYYACPSNAELPLEETTTDAGGSAAIEHVGEAPLSIRVQADGFQADELTGLRLDPAKPHRWTLQPTPPLRGTVTATATGQPIAGAVIKLAGVRGPHNETHYDPRQAPVLTSADAKGRFTLGSLRPDSRYYLFVEAPGYGGAYLREIKLASGDLDVALGPELVIRGKLIHIPDSVVHLGKVHLQFNQSFGFDENFTGAASQVIDVQPVNGEADFVAGPFYQASGARPVLENAPLWEKKTVGLYVDSWARATFGVDELPVSDFMFDLARKTNDRNPSEADTATEPTRPTAAGATGKDAAPASGRLDGTPPASNAQTDVSLSGVVTAAEDGRPLAGARVRLVGKMARTAPDSYDLWTAENKPTTTDAQGRFSLAGLHPDAVYWLCVESPGHGAKYIAIDKIPSGELQVKLSEPERFIRGRIVHAPTSMIHDGKLTLSFRQMLDSAGSTPREQDWTTVKLEPKDGSADFVAGPFYLPEGDQPLSKAPVTLRVDGSEKAYFRGEDLPGSDYVLNLAPDFGQIAGEYKTAPDSPRTLDLRSDGTAVYYWRDGGRYTACCSRQGSVVTLTFPDGLQERLEVDGAQLLGMPGNQVLPNVGRLRRVGERAVSQTGFDDLLLNAKINVAVLGLDYTDRHPKMVEARAELDTLSRTTAEVPLATYRSHLQERIDEAQREDSMLKQEYRQHHPRRQKLTEKLKFLRGELQRIQGPEAPPPPKS